MNSNKQLTRSTANGEVAGVCAGLAEYFGIDVVLVRAAFVVATLMGGPGLILYIVLMFVMPKDDAESYPRPRRTVDVYEEEKPKRV